MLVFASRVHGFDIIAVILSDNDIFFAEKNNGILYKFSSFSWPVNSIPGKHAASQADFLIFFKFMSIII